MGQAQGQSGQGESALSGSAIFSACGHYRYLLTRQFGEPAPDDPTSPKVATFIMLNPSTADATHNDPTIRKCIGFARRWQCHTLQVLNLFAVRATLPRAMKRATEPIGPENLQWFTHALTANPSGEHLIVCAWGVHGVHLSQDRAILRWLQEQKIAPLALGFTRDGHPRHPLYVRYSTELVALHV
jgi:hypothetical protein